MAGQTAAIDLRIELLGRFSVSAAGRPVDEAAWRLRKARSLVKLLALAADHRLHREHVMEALWPDREAAAAANNLRQAVFVARRALDSCGVDGGVRLVLQREVLRLTVEEVDVEAFEIAAAAAHGSGDVERHRTAIALYRGELLPEDRFDEWAGGRRQALRERHLGLLVDIAGLLERDGDPAGAVAALQQALLEEPLHEEAHRRLMRLYVTTGRRQRALAQYHVLRTSLQREFEDEPDDETRRLYRDVLAGRLTERAQRETAAPGRRLAAGRPPGNLPLQLTSFVGRERELGELVGLLERTRLLTLTGPGGCGKTRLALEASARLRRRFPDGVWLVELAGLVHADPEQVAQAVASVLGVESYSGRPFEDALTTHVGDGRLLVVLDTCEHLIDACAHLTAPLLGACPGLVVLATSREPLHVRGEVAWRVPSLSLPERTDGAAVAELERSEAVRLFCDRAANAASPFALSASNGAAVGELCRRLDGIPLAIELAAARTSVLTPGQIAARLHDSLAVLATADPSGLTRQGTLTAAIDWSHSLLQPDERILFRRLGVFAGGCWIESVEEICAGDDLASADVLDVLGRLVDKSLVIVDEEAGLARYRLLDTVRSYARDRLARAGERAAMEARHGRHFAALAEAAEPGLIGAHPEATQQRLESTDADLQAALHRALSAEPEIGVRLAGALWRFWHARGSLTEGVRWLEATLRAAPGPSAARARALLGLSVLAVRVGDQPRARSAAEEAVSVCREIGDPLATADALHWLGCHHWLSGSLEGVRRHARESRALGERIGAPGVVAAVRHTMGVVEGSRRAAGARDQLDASLALLRTLAPDGEPLLLPLALGFLREARGAGVPPRLVLEETLLTARRVRPRHAVGYALADRAVVARDEGDHPRGRADLEEALSIFRRLGDTPGAAQVLGQLGNLRSVQGDHELARELHDESRALREAAGDARGLGWCLNDLGVAAARAGDRARAVAELARARALFERTDDRPGLIATLVHLGYVAADDGRPEAARELLERALWSYTEVLDDALCAAWVSIALAEIDVALHAAGRARERLHAAIVHFRRAGEGFGESWCERLLGELPDAALTSD